MVENKPHASVIAGIVEQSAKTERNELFMTFGALLKELRIVKELTLRQCSADLDVDPSNWSKIERNITPAPKDLAVLERWAAFFALSGDKKSEFLDLAALARKEIPADMASDETVIGALPAFFRAVRGQELSGARLKEFLQDLKAVHSPDKE